MCREVDGDAVAALVQVQALDLERLDMQACRVLHGFQDAGALIRGHPAHSIWQQRACGGVEGGDRLLGERVALLDDVNRRLERIHLGAKPRERLPLQRGELLAVRPICAVCQGARARQGEAAVRRWSG